MVRRRTGEDLDREILGTPSRATTQEASSALQRIRQRSDLCRIDSRSPTPQCKLQRCAVVNTVQPLSSRVYAPKYLKPAGVARFRPLVFHDITAIIPTTYIHAVLGRNLDLTKYFYLQRYFVVRCVLSWVVSFDLIMSSHYSSQTSINRTNFGQFRHISKIQTPMVSKGPKNNAKQRRNESVIMVWNPLEDLAMQQKPNPNFTTKRHACFWYPS